MATTEMAELAMKQWAIPMATLAILMVNHPPHSLVADHLSKHTITRGHHPPVHLEINILHLRMDKDRNSIHHNNTHHNSEVEVNHQVQEDEDHHLRRFIRMATCHHLLITDRTARCHPKVVCHHRMASQCHDLDLECKTTDRAQGVSHAEGRLQEVPDRRTCMDTMSLDRMVGNQ
jgi:hypothetical protein